MDKMTTPESAGDVIVDSRPVRELKAHKEWHRGSLQNVGQANEDHWE